MFKNKIDVFKRYTKKPNTISRGALYIATLKFLGEDKIIRVYVPHNYDFENKNKRFPTIYMFDGQNIVDKYTTAFGEWNIDEEINIGIKNKLIEGLIVVGIDSPADDIKRMNEMNPTTKNIQIPYDTVINEEHLDEFMDFIVNEVKPLVDKTFFTKKEREFTLLGGSSMGGLASFVGQIKYNNIFKGALSFSPAFCLYTNESIIEEINKFDFNKMGKIYFFMGNKGFEKELYPAMNVMYNELCKHDIDHKIKYVFDSEGEHNEAEWRKHFLEAIIYLLKI